MRKKINLDVTKSYAPPASCCGRLAYYVLRLRANPAVNPFGSRDVTKVRLYRPSVRTPTDARSADINQARVLGVSSRANQ